MKLELDPIGHMCTKCNRSWVYNDCNASSNPRERCTREAIECPACSGSKLPPKTPIRISDQYSWGYIETFATWVQRVRQKNGKQRKSKNITS